MNRLTNQPTSAGNRLPESRSGASSIVESDRDMEDSCTMEQSCHWLKLVLDPNLFTFTAGGSGVAAPDFNTNACLATCTTPNHIPVWD